MGAKVMVFEEKKIVLPLTFKKLSKKRFKNLNMRTIYCLIVFLLMVILAISACRPSEEPTIPLPTSICIQTQHHEVPKPAINILIKYNSDTFPGYDQPVSFYDTLLVTDSNGRICVSPVPVGKHWIVALGFDEHAQQVLPVFGRLPVYIDLQNKPKVDTILYLYE